MRSVDFTFESAPTLIEEKLGKEEKAQYLKPEYRVRIDKHEPPLLQNID